MDVSCCNDAFYLKVQPFQGCVNRVYFPWVIPTAINSKPLRGFVFGNLENLVERLMKVGDQKYSILLVNIALYHIPNLDNLCIVETESEEYIERFQMLKKALIKIDCTTVN